MSLAPFEEKMWEDPTLTARSTMSDDQIDAKYDKGEQRILTEINREKLPIFVEALKKPGYMDVQPYYQRMQRWDGEKQSKLIESFLINIPVPPIVLYEKEYNSYEVMDGQQRITAIKNFYNNSLTLTGLELWPELNGRTYKTLPPKIRAGIDRRSISSIVLITESASSPEEALFLKQLAFERLNTGGVSLSPQEVRNCLYHGNFNSRLKELVRNPIFLRAWKIPTDDEPDKLAKNNLHKKMEDSELVLRFFAMRNFEYFRGNLKDFLDLYMIKSIKFYDEDIKFLENLFIDTITLADKIYGSNLFCAFDPDNEKWIDRPYKTYYEAVMVGFSRHLSHANLLIERKSTVIEKTKNLFIGDRDDRLLTGGGKTKADIQKRIELFDDMLSQVIAE